MSPAPMPTLELLEEDQAVFRSWSRWLHPLFELEEFLGSSEGVPVSRRLKRAPETFLLRDTVVGRAGAFLIDRLGLVRVEGGLVSQLAAERLEARGIRWKARTVVEKISCVTEDLLATMTDPEEVYSLLYERRRTALARLS